MKILENIDKGKEAQWIDDTSPIDMEKGVNDINHENNENNDKVRDTECPDYTTLVEMEEGVSDRW